MADPRTVRQRLVPEIGEEGQARITAGTALVVATGLSGEVEAHYLAGAGFGLVRTSTHAATRAVLETNPTVAIATDADPLGDPKAGPVPSTVFADQPLSDALGALCSDPSARAVAQGAARALRQVRVAARIDVVPVMFPGADQDQLPS